MNDLLLPPRSPWKRAGRVIAAGIVGATVVTGIGLAAHHVMHDVSFRVQRVGIHGAERARVAQLRHLADVPYDAHLATVDLDAIRRGVERHPWVAEATVDRAFPSGIEVHIVEHEPVMLLALDQLWYVDGAGRPIKRANTADLDFPVVTGVSQHLATTRPELAAAVTTGALRLLHAADGSAVDPAAISEIHHDPHTGYHLVLRSGTRLVIGNGDPAPALARLARLIGAGLDLDQPQRIDLAVETVAIATPLPDLP